MELNHLTSRYRLRQVNMSAPNLTNPRPLKIGEKLKAKVVLSEQFVSIEEVGLKMRAQRPDSFRADPVRTEVEIIFCVKREGWLPSPPVIRIVSAPWNSSNVSAPF